MNQWIAMFIMAFVTYLPRMLPLVFVEGKIKNIYIQSLLYYVPYAVLAALTFPAIFSSVGSSVGALAGTITAIVLAYFEKGLVVVATGAVIAVYIAG